MDYLQSLSKANALIRQLDIDEGLEILYQLLEDHPFDIDLIERIYALEIKRPERCGFSKIAHHIFDLSSQQPETHKLIVRTFGDYIRVKNELPPLAEKRLFNLFFQLSKSHFESQMDTLKSTIKSHYANHPKTPLALQHYCEALLSEKKLILAREELKYLIAYYAETESGRWALKMKKWVESNIQ